MRGSPALSDLWGSRCAGCGRPAGALCPSCGSSLRPWRGRVSVPGARDVAAAYVYSGAARSLVLGLKLRGDAAYAAPLSNAMAESIRGLGCGCPVVTWVPARRRDLGLRGIDHARVLAAGVASRLGLEVRPLLARTGRVVLDQAGLDARERSRNLEGAFVARASARSVLVIDDLVTTGATAKACVAALHDGGSGDVWVVAACGPDRAM